MTNIIEDIRGQVRNTVENALAAAAGKSELPAAE